MVFDACRTFGFGADVQPFNPAILTMQFEQSLEVHFFFSGDVGQPAYQIEGLSFEQKQPGSRKGNGLFTYAFLDALTNQRAAVHADPTHDVIKVSGLDHYLRDEFFNTQNPSSPSMILKAKHPEWPYLPEPQILPARNRDADKVVRSLGLYNRKQ